MQVLHVEGLPGQAGPHLEVAFTADEAQVRRDLLLTPVPPDASAGVVWTIAGRVPGDGVRGSTQTESLPQSSTDPRRNP